MPECPVPAGQWGLRMSLDPAGDTGWLCPGFGAETPALTPNLGQEKAPSTAIPASGWHRAVPAALLGIPDTFCAIPDVSVALLMPLVPFLTIFVPFLVIFVPFLVVLCHS